MTPPSKTWEVAIEEKGRCGTIYYREGAESMPFFWEFGGGNNIIAIISGPKPADWDGSHPWARGRRSEIMRRVAEALIRKQGRGCKPEFEDETTTIYLRSTRVWTALFLFALLVAVAILVWLLRRKS
jgi:hypothetical protein